MCIRVCVCMCVHVNLCVCLHTCAPCAPRVGQQPSSPPFSPPTHLPEASLLPLLSDLCVPSGQGCKVTAVILGDPWVSPCEYLDCACSPSLARHMHRWPCREAHGG